MQNIRHLGLIVLALAVGGVGGYLIPHPKSSPTPLACQGGKATTEARQGGYTYINPLLECELNSPLENTPELSTLKHALEDQIASLTSSTHISRIALYFRDLNNGPWFGIHEDDTFTPASLLKTPMMLAYLKLAETDPNLLSRRLTFKPRGEPESPYPGIASLRPEASYSVQELIERMIIYSDNDAFDTLTLNIDEARLQAVHKDLGLAYPDPTTPEDFITVKEYAGLFRVLYNASYLSRNMSELALSILSRASYQDGLVKGVADGTVVAHKFGVRRTRENANQLHDCGIIYLPNHPYLLCVMTKGDDLAVQTDALGKLSAQVFSTIKSLP